MDTARLSCETDFQWVRTQVEIAHARERTAELPLFVAMDRGEISPQAMREVALQVRHVVAAFPRFLAALISRLESTSMRMVLVENLYNEHGRMRSDAVHLHTYDDFLRSLAIGDDEIDECRAIPGVTAYIRSVLDLCLNGGEAESLAAVGVIEEVVAHASPIVTRAGRAFLRSEANTGRLDQAHFGLHAVLDLEHADELHDLAACHAATCSAEILRGIEIGFYLQRRLYADLLAHAQAFVAASVRCILIE